MGVGWAERKALRWGIRLTRIQVFGDESVQQKVEEHLLRAGRQLMHRKRPKERCQPRLGITEHS